MSIYCHVFLSHRTNQVVFQSQHCSLDVLILEVECHAIFYLVPPSVAFCFLLCLAWNALEMVLGSEQRWLGLTVATTFVSLEVCDGQTVELPVAQDVALVIKV